MILDTTITRFLLLLGLGFFFGLAFEEFHARAKQARPGGVRSFPLLALVGGAGAMFSALRARMNGRRK